MTSWVRFQIGENQSFGQLDNGLIHEYTGELFADNQANGVTYPIDDVELLAPCKPAKIIALWNNFHALAEKQGHEIPEMPYYFLKPSSCVIGPGTPIRSPESYSGRIFYEGELGIVIGRNCKNVNEEEALSFVKGYTCVNDVTAMQLIAEKPAFAQWARAKSFDTFGVIGPCITELADPSALSVKTLLNGRERQNYPVSDMIFSPAQIVSLLSQDMTLEAGDVIACGTSLGALPMKPGMTVEVVIEGIGTLENDFNP